MNNCKLPYLYVVLLTLSTGEIIAPSSDLTNHKDAAYQALNYAPVDKTGAAFNLSMIPSLEKLQVKYLSQLEPVISSDQIQIGKDGTTNRVVSITFEALEKNTSG